MPPKSTYFNDLYEADANRKTPVVVQGLKPLSQVQSSLEDQADEEARVSANIYPQICAVYSAVVAHVIVMACTDPLVTNSTVTHVLVFSLQLFLLLATAMIFFIYTSHTFFVRVGLYQRYISHYRWTFSSFLLAVALLLATRSYNLALVYQGQSSPHIAHNTSYHPLWITCRLSLLLFYCTISCSTTSTLKVEMFTPRCLGRR